MAKSKSNGSGKAKKSAQATWGAIDATMSVLGKLPNYPDVVIDTNPFGFIVDLCKRLGVYDELIEYLSNFLVKSLPIIELGVKGILLSNLKDMTVGCDVDPMIPQKFRLNNKLTGYTQTGFEFNVDTMDYANVLKMNPYGVGGEYKYLGIEQGYKIVPYEENKTVNETIVTNTTLQNQIFDKYTEAYTFLEVNNLLGKYKIIRNNDDKSIYELARPTDFNAFLWFVINKAFFTNPSIIKVQKNTTIEDSCKQFFTQIFNQRVTSNNASILGSVDVSPNIIYDEITSDVGFKNYTLSSKTKFIYPGDLFVLEYDYTTNSGSSQKKVITPYAICTSVDYDYDVKLKQKIVKTSHIMPISMNGVSANWYANKAHYFDFLKLRKNITKRNYAKDFPILNVQYEGNRKNDNNRLISCNSLHVNILPKPFVHIPNITKGNTDVLPKKILLNENGKLDSNGKFSCRVNPNIKDEWSPLTKLTLSTNKLKNIVNIVSTWIYRGRWDFLSTELESVLKNADMCYKYFGISNTIDIDIYKNSALWWQHALYSENNLKKFFKEQYEVDENDLVDDEDTSYLIKYISESGMYEFGLMVNEIAETKFTNGSGTRYQLIDNSESMYPVGWMYIDGADTSNIIFTQYDGEDGGKILDSCPLGAMYECYAGLTVYEFNYDYVMSQRLFDAKVVTYQLINNLLRYNISGNLQLTDITETDGSQRIAQIIKNIITADTYASTDCFFTFDNDEIDAMQREAELKKVNGYEIHGELNETITIDGSKIESILMEYDDNATLQEKKDVLKRAFNEVSVSITEAIDGEISGLNLKLDIISKLLEDLINVLINAIVSPKFVMLFEINKQLFGDTTEYDNMQKFLQSIVGLIVSIVKQLKALLIQQLMDFLISLLQPIFGQLASLLLKEYYEYYSNLIKQIIRDCTFSFSGRKNINTTLDKVDYADIDEPNTQPLNTEC